MPKAVIMAAIVGALVAPATAPAGGNGPETVVVPVGSAEVKVIEIGVNPSSTSAPKDSRQSSGQNRN